LGPGVIPALSLKAPLSPALLPEPAHLHTGVTRSWTGTSRS